MYKELYEKEISRKSNRVRNHVEGLERVKRNSDYIYLGKFLWTAAACTTVQSDAISSTQYVRIDRCIHRARQTVPLQRIDECI